MRIVKFGSLLAALGTALALVPSGNAAAVTVGSPLVGDFSQTSFGGAGGPNTWINEQLQGPGANPTSPTDGVVIRWRMSGNFTGGPFRLRVLRPQGGGAFAAIMSSAPVVPTGAPATQVFPTSLPIRAGDYVALDPATTTDKIGTRTPSSAANRITYFNPQFVDGGPSQTLDGFFNPAGELGFNADVLAPPEVSAIAPANGSFLGGTNIRITGKNFAEVQAVKFGATPVASYSVKSDTEISAVAPKATTPSKVEISVSTPAGTGASAGRFEYKACKVPKLKKKSLKSAKKSLKKAGCKLGKVKKTDGVTSKSGRVNSQKKKAGKLLAPGTKINLTLGPK